MKIIVSISPNESRISAKVEKRYGNNTDNMIFTNTDVLPTFQITRILLSKPVTNPSYVHPMQDFIY